MRTRATADYAMRSAAALDLKSNDFCHLHFWSFLSVINQDHLEIFLNAETAATIE